jgi:hypothetical protein
LQIYNKQKEVSIKVFLFRIKHDSILVLNISTSKSSLINQLKLNLTDNLDDYPTDNEFDYSDYAYEDPIDEQPSSTARISSTTLQSTSVSIYDDISIDDINTVSYYDYGEQDVYSDDEIVDPSTQQTTTTTITTTIIRIPSYHRRRPIIWNINLNDDDDVQQSKQQYNSSFTLNYSFLLFLSLLIFSVT